MELELYYLNGKCRLRPKEKQKIKKKKEEIMKMMIATIKMLRKKEKKSLAITGLMKIIFNYLKYPRTTSLLCILSAFHVLRTFIHHTRKKKLTENATRQWRIGINLNDTSFCVLLWFFGRINDKNEYILYRKA